MSQLSDILRFNAAFVERRDYVQYQTTRLPDKRLVVLSCMDTRLTELLPRAMNLRNGDAKIIKSAGAVVAHPFGSIMRSILVAVYELGVSDIAVVGHHDCGMLGFNCKSILAKAHDRGINPATVDALRNAGVNLEQWLKGFETVDQSVRSSVQMVRNHPLLPADVRVHGLIIDPATGLLDTVVDGDNPAR